MPFTKEELDIARTVYQIGERLGMSLNVGPGPVASSFAIRGKDMAETLALFDRLHTYPDLMDAARFDDKSWPERIQLTITKPAVLLAALEDLRDGITEVTAVDNAAMPLTKAKSVPQPRPERIWSEAELHARVARDLQPPSAYLPLQESDITLKVQSLMSDFSIDNDVQFKNFPKSNLHSHIMVTDPGAAGERSEAIAAMTEHLQKFDIPVEGKAFLLTIDLRGDLDELNRKLGEATMDTLQNPPPQLSGGSATQEGATPEPDKTRRK